MNPLESLHESVLRAVPNAWCRVRRPRDPEGVWWLDVKADGHLVAVEWSSRRGFGISASVLGDGYGEGPEETIQDQGEATARVVSLLEKRGFTSPPAAVALRELRAVLGQTQQEVANTLGVGQAAVSRLEHREDITLGSLRRYVEALGATLDIRVRTASGDDMPLMIGTAGVGKSRTFALLCRHLEQRLTRAGEATRLESAGKASAASSCRR